MYFYSVTLGRNFHRQHVTEISGGEYEGSNGICKLYHPWTNNHVNATKYGNFQIKRGSIFYFVPHHAISGHICKKMLQMIWKTINYSYSWEEMTSFSFWSVLASIGNLLTRILPVLSSEWIFLNAHVLRMFFLPVRLLLWQSLYHSEICRSKKRRGLIRPLWLHLTMLNFRWSFTHLMLDQLLILCILRYSKLNKKFLLFVSRNRQTVQTPWNSI